MTSPGCRHGGWCSWGCAREPSEAEREIRLLRKFAGELAIILGLLPPPPPADPSVPF